ncbi:MAG: hypothetical protein AAFY16_06835 [Cyanobacteria bacterium J06642_3]
MPKLDNFDTPAYQNDFVDDATKAKILQARWSNNINRFTEQALQNDPWNSSNQPPLTEYFNLLNTEVPANTPGVPITWTAFPRRIQITYPNQSQRTQWQYADEGPPDANYSPQGPRGWQDEYCEWSVTRNPQGKITKVMFTCENREYWYSLWDVDPNQVLKIYQEVISDQVKIEDLYLYNQGQPVVDPETGRPAYNDLNKWNNSTTYGAIHLISNPNSLSAEIFLGGQATILRQTSDGTPITDKNQLINCSRYGTANRNSDPTIGAAVNSLVRGGGAANPGVRVSLQNPIGLYIQQPNFGAFQLPFTAPAEAKVEDCWRVIRGRQRQQGEDIDYILHAVFEVPEEWGFTVSDITINGFPIDYGSQITEQFQIALSGVGISQTPPPPASLTCVRPLRDPLPRAYYLRDVDLLNVAIRSSLNMRIEPGTTVNDIGLYAINSDRNATIEFTGAPGITVEQTGFQTLSGGDQLFILSITAASDAPLGDRSLLLTNSNGVHGPAVYGLLEVVAPGTLEGGTPQKSVRSMSMPLAMASMPRQETYMIR